MGIFNFLKKNNRSLEVPSFDKWKSTLSGGADIENSLELMGIIDFIGGLIGSLTIKVWEKKDGKEERIEDGLAYLLDIAPFEDMTRIEWMKLLVKRIFLDGKAYIYPHRKKELITKLEVLPKPYLKGDRLFYTQGGETKSVLKEECLSFSFYGFEIHNLLKEKIKNIQQTAKLKRHFFEGAFNPNFLIKVDMAFQTMFDEKTRKEIIEQIEKSRLENQSVVIPSGEMELEALPSLNYESLGITTALNSEKIAMANALGVPPFLFGVGNYNADEYNAFVKTFLLPKIKVIEQGLSRLFYSPSRFVKFSVKSLYQFDLEEQASLVNNGISLGYITGNEAREFLGFERKDDPELDKFKMLENYIPIADSGNQKKLKNEE